MCRRPLRRERRLHVDRDGPGRRAARRPHYRATRRYTTPLIIDAAVEIVGDGPCEEIVIRVAGAACLTSSAERVLVRGVSLLAVGRPSDDDSPVIAGGGMLRLEECRIGSGVIDAIVVDGTGVRLDATNCTISGVAGSGVTLARRAHG